MPNIYVLFSLHSYFSIQFYIFNDHNDFIKKIKIH